MLERADDPEVEQHVSLERAIEDEAAFRVGKIRSSGRQQIRDARGQENQPEGERSSSVATETVAGIGTAPRLRRPRD